MKFKYKILKYRIPTFIFSCLFGMFLAGFNIYLSFLAILIGIVVLGMTELYLNINKFEFEFYDKSTGEIIENKTMSGLEALRYANDMDYGGRLITK